MPDYHGLHVHIPCSQGQIMAAQTKYSAAPQFDSKVVLEGRAAKLP